MRSQRAGPLHMLFKLVTIGGRLGGRRGAGNRERTSAEITTQLIPGRGEALRAAHRTLRRHMVARPALRSVAPHLSAVERALGKQGSRALYKLPMAALRRALEQLAMLQRDDESEDDANNLRVLRLRLMEAINLRASRAGRGVATPPAPAPAPTPAPGAGVEVRHISVDEYNRAVEVSKPPQLVRLNKTNPRQ